MASSMKDINKAAKKNTVAIELDVPLAPVRAGCFVTEHFDIRLSPESALFMKRLLEGLAAANAKLASGSPVDPNRPIHALRWLIEQATNQVKQSGV